MISVHLPITQSTFIAKAAIQSHPDVERISSAVNGGELSLTYHLHPRFNALQEIAIESQLNRVGTIINEFI